MLANEIDGQNLQDRNRPYQNKSLPPICQAACWLSISLQMLLLTLASCLDTVSTVSNFTSNAGALYQGKESLKGNNKV